MTIRRKLLSFGSRSTDVRLGYGALDELAKFFSGAVGKPCRAFLLSSSSVEGEVLLKVRRALVDAGFRVSEAAVEDSAALRVDSAVSLYADLAVSGITGEDLIVGVGGHEVCSLASYVSRTWRGGVSCSLVPVTLDAMMSCATQMTPLAVEGDDAAVSIAPEVSLVVCELDLVSGRGVDENGWGYVLMCAAHLSESRACWDGFGATVQGVVDGSEASVIEALSTTLTARLNIAKSVSPSARRATLFGQTTARALASCWSGDLPPRYLLLAEGMRFEARLAIDVCDFSVDEVFALDDHLEDLGVGGLSFDIDVDTFIEALRAERFRRANRFQLALPKYPGVIRLSSVEDEVLERHARAFLASRKPD